MEQTKEAPKASKQIINVDGKNGYILHNQDTHRRAVTQTVKTTDYFGNRKGTGDTPQRGYVQLHSGNSGLHSTNRTARKDYLGERNVNAVDIPQRNYRENSRVAGCPSTRKPSAKLNESLFSAERCKSFCETPQIKFSPEERFILVEEDSETVCEESKRECEEICVKCKDFEMEPDLEKYKHSESSKDIGVQVTTYHCNDCRRHLKYNQEYNIPPLTKEGIFDYQAENSPTNTEGLTHETNSTVNLDPVQPSNNCEISDHSSYLKHEALIENPYEQEKRIFIKLLQPTERTEHNNFTEETMGEEVPCCDNLIQANATINKPIIMAQTKAFFERMFNKFNSYRIFTKSTIVISICLLLVAWMAAGNYFYSKHEEKPKKELTYYEWASNMLMLIVGRCKLPFWFSLMTLV